MHQKFAKVLFIHPDGKNPKTFFIPSLLYSKSKLLISAFSFKILLVLFLAGFFYFSYTNERSKNDQLQQQIEVMQKDVKLVDSLGIKNKVNSIEEKLGIINSFLKKKGIPVDSSMGGDLTEEELDNPLAVYEHYEKEASLIFNEFQTIPAGLPYTGSITSRFGPRRNPFTGKGGEIHGGIDFKGPVGAHIKVTANGIVSHSGVKGGYGNLVIVKHGNGYETYYGHLSKTNVQVGEQVSPGDVIGFLGSTGRSTGPHLHYEVRKNGVRINPMDYLPL